MIRGQTNLTTGFKRGGLSKHFQYTLCHFIRRVGSRFMSSKKNITCVISINVCRSQSTIRQHN